MKLISLRLHNFRQFRGTTPELTFAAPGENPVTVFFGTNGAGKTALLNSFTWTLYDSTTEGFLPDQVVNKSALREAKTDEIVEAWVELKFEHNGNRYFIRKTERVRRGATVAEIAQQGPPVTELQWTGPDGVTRTEQSYKDAIGRILPADLHSYFFFDGERIERISKQSDKERADIANATKKLFSLEILERAVKHVDAVKRTLQTEYERIGDTQVHQLLSDMRKMESEIQSIEERVRELDANIAQDRLQQDEIDAKLLERQATREIQVRRDGLRRDRDTRTESLRLADAEASRLVSSKAYSVFLPAACQTYHSVVEQMRRRGELPSGIKTQFVQDLLDRSVCICGRSLGHADAASSREIVEGWMTRAGIPKVEENAILMGAEVDKIRRSNEEFWQKLDEIETRRAGAREDLSRIESDLETISEQLKSHSEEEVASLEAKRSALRSSIDGYNREQGSKAEAIRLARQRHAELEDKLEKTQASEAKQELARRRVVAATQVISAIQRAKERWESKVRADLEKKVRALFSEITYTPYYPEILEDYSVRLRESAGGIPLPVAASTGESQVLSLCFIGAVIDLTRDYQFRKEHLSGAENTQFPVVMDSPFGYLGPTYRRQVADHITRLADQIVMMVTNTQWRGEVDQSLRSRVGRQYLIVYYTTKPDTENEDISLGARSYELIRQSSSEYEYSAIVEVASG